MITTKNIRIISIGLGIAILVTFGVILALEAFYPKSTIISNYPETTITINGEVSTTPYQKRLKIGEYLVTAEKSGYQEQELIFNVRPFSNNRLEITMALRWLTPEEFKKLSKEEQRNYEELSDSSADYNEATLRDLHPLVKSLPYSNPAKGFRIDYKGTVFNTYYIINLFGTTENELTIAKKNALSWIRTKEINPKELNIEFIENLESNQDNNYLE